MISKLIHTKGFKWFIALLLIVLFLVSYAGAGRMYISDTTVHGNELTDKEKASYENITVTYEEGMPEDILTQCQEAVEEMPADAIQRFSDDGWKIAVVSRLDTSAEATGTAVVDNAASVKGMTDYSTKTVTVVCNEEQESVTSPLAHELSHYCDGFYGERDFNDAKYYITTPDRYLVSGTEDFLKVYLEYRDKYVEFELSSVKKSGENSKAFEYPASSGSEFFACAFRDYRFHSAYVKDYYPDIYAYFSRLEAGKAAEPGNS